MSSAWAQERVVLDALREDGYARLILTFPDRLTLPAHEVTSDNGVLVIALDDETMQGILPDVGVVLGEYLAVARFDPDRSAIRVGLRQAFRVNTIAAGEQLYVDLLPADWVGLPPSLPQEVIEKLAHRAEDAARIAEERRRAEMVEEYNPTATVSVGRHPTFSRVVFDWNVGTQAEFVQEGEAATLTFDWPVPIDLYPLLADLPAQIAEVGTSVHPGGTEIEFLLAEDVGLRFYQTGPSQFIVDVDNPHAHVEALDPAALIAEAEAEAVPAAIAPASEQLPRVIEAAMDPVEEIVPQVSTIGSTVRIVFPFQTETASAVFRRGNTVWMIFDSAAPVVEPEPASRDLMDGLVKDLSVQAAGASQVVRMELSESRLATLGSEGMAWVLSIGETMLSSPQPIGLDRRKDAAGLFEVVAQLGRPGAVHQLRDPVVGDVLDVVTVFPPARGMVRDLHYVDFLAPQSVHGLVIKPLHGGVRVRIEDQAAVVSSATGLTISNADVARHWSPEGQSDSALNLAGMLARSPAEFEAKRADFAARAATSEGADRDRARLDLAQFYLGNNLAMEALGVLRVLESDLGQTGLADKMRATQAAANALVGRADEAMALLNVEAMRGEPDAAIWSAIALAEKGENYAAARLDALGARGVVGNYPPWVNTRFLLAGLRAAVMQEDAAMAAEFLGNIDVSHLDDDQLAQYELFGGMIDKMTGRTTEALESFGRVIVADRRPTNAEAVLRTIQALDETGQLDVEQAIGALNVQATIWRGGPLELEMIEALTDLLYRNDRYREAFVLTRDATTIALDSPAMDRLLTRARTEFAGLYLDGKADAIEPIEALSIYYDYPELTPPGADGDMMIRNLAHRLIKVDLLAQAAELLRYQVDNRLEGASRAQVAADLAVVYIANRDPNSALHVLSDTRLAGLPPALERQRRILEASALISAGRQELALDLLSSLSGKDTELLRIDALWKAGRFQEASERIEGLYVADADAGALSPVARINIVKAAVGYVMAKDAMGIARLRGRFSEAMSEVPEWPMFALVTEETDPTATQFRQIAAQVADTSSINAFLNAYREIYAGKDALAPLREAEVPGPVASL